MARGGGAFSGPKGPFEGPRGPLEGPRGPFWPSSEELAVVVKTEPPGVTRNPTRKGYFVWHFQTIRARYRGRLVETTATHIQAHLPSCLHQGFADQDTCCAAVAGLRY